MKKVRFATEINGINVTDERGFQVEMKNKKRQTIKQNGK
jgi:hypothetical protein